MSLDKNNLRDVTTEVETGSPWHGLHRVAATQDGATDEGGDGIVIVGADGRIVHANSIAEGYFLAEPGGLCGRLFGHAIACGESSEIDIFLSSGRRSSAEMRCSPLEWEQAQAYLISLRKARERRRSKAAHPASDFLHALVAGSPMAIIATDADGRITQWNPAAAEMLGWSDMDVLGHSLPATSSDGEESLHGVWEAVMRGQEVRGIELPGQHRRDGLELAVQVWGSQIHRGQGFFSGVMLILADVTARRRVEAHIRHLVGHDTLTGLPNRRQFGKQLQRTLNKKGHREHMPLMVLQLGIDRFKNINKSIGHGGGDHLLQAVARRLAGALYETDLVARTGNDEFSILLRDTHHLRDGARVADKLLQELANTPFMIQGQELFITASIGIAVHPHDGSRSGELIHAADNAMDRAKHNGGNGCQFNTRDLDSDARQQLGLERGLHRALEREELFLEYQPQFDLESGRMAGVEALLRWQHPLLGRVAPGDFIGVAESSGLIVPIGAWVLRTACLQLRDWDEAGLPPLRIAVNVSARQFQSSELKSEVRQALQVSGISPQRLELELTESLLVRNAPEAIEAMHSLRALGIRLSIDDFGTGYSGLSYLVDLPVDTLKIDQSFIRRLHELKGNQAIVSAIGKLAHGLGLSVIAEGVETAAQLEFLEKIGCDEVQGYLLSRPLAADDVARLLLKHGAIAA